MRKPWLIGSTSIRGCTNNNRMKKDSPMDETSDSYTLYNEIVRFCYATSKDEEKKMIEMLQEGFNINTAVPHCNPLRFAAPDLIDSTAVHHACSKDPLSQIPFLKSSVFVFNGADFTVANNSGSTALHLSLEKTLKCFLNVIGDGRDGIKLALSTLIERGIKCNPKNKHGLSHLHIACMMSHVETVRYFLNNGCSVNDVIQENSPFLSGYSALHLAAYFGSLAVVELLLKVGANVDVENAEGYTPLQLSFERLEMVHRDCSSESTAIIQRFKHDTIRVIELLMGKCFGEDLNLVHKLCFACVERSTSKVEELIKMKVDVNAKVTSLDLTALHFAAHSSFIVTQQLIKHGANIFAKDTQGRSPLDICIDKYGCRTIFMLPSINSLKNYVLLRDHVTRLVTIFHLNEGNLRVMGAFRNLQDMNTSCVSFGAPMWPGFTLLHLAVTFSEPQPCAHKFGCWYTLPSETVSCLFIKYLISCGADVTRQDARGQTALHLAFYLKKKDITHLILESYNNYESNPADASGLSHFHIACIMGNIDVMKKYIAKNIDVNGVVHSNFEVNHKIEEPSISFKAGTTALHIAIRMKNFDVVKLLLEHKADVRLKDADGMTPVHTIARANGFSMAEMFAMMDLLLPRIMQHDQFEDFCKSLKVPLAEIDPVSINTLLKFESALSKLLWSPMIKENPQVDAETEIKNYFKNLKILKLMMDTNVETPHISADHLIDAFKFDDMKDNIPKRFRIETVASLMSLDWKNLDIIDTKSGMTQLHVACAIINIDGIESLLESGADINCKLNSDSPVYAGYTPLHIAVEFSRFVKAKYEDVVKLLLRNGADPSIQDVKDETPLHLAYKFNEKFIMAILLQDEKIGSSNPTNQLGLSHFHIACSQNLVELVRKFIRSGVDLNACNYVSHLTFWDKAQGSPYAKNCGCTPLQMATCPIVVGLLLLSGADSNVEDYRGWNALHYACKRLKYSVMKCLIKSGKVNINAATIKGATPLNFFLKMVKSGSSYRDWGILKLFLAYGALINKNAFKDAIEGDSSEMLDILVDDGADSFIIRDGEENAMHEVFKGHSFDLDDCLKYINVLNGLGFDIDSQNSEGKTPLHLAFEHGEGWGVIALLMSGANVNMHDFDGKLAYRRDIGAPVLKFYFQYVEKLQIFGHHTNTFIKVKLLMQHKEVFGDNSELSERQEAYLEHEELTKMGNILLSENLSLYDSLFMKRSQLSKIADNERLIGIQDSGDFHEAFPEFGGILKFQMRIAERERLRNLARKSLHSFFKSKLPELCVQCIIFYLKKHDLRSVISLE